MCKMPSANHSSSNKTAFKNPMLALADRPINFMRFKHDLQYVAGFRCGKIQSVVLYMEEPLLHIVSFIGTVSKRYVDMGSRPLGADGEHCQHKISHKFLLECSAASIFCVRPSSINCLKYLSSIVFLVVDKS